MKSICILKDNEISLKHIEKLENTVNRIKEYSEELKTLKSVTFQGKEMDIKEFLNQQIRGLSINAKYRPSIGSASSFVDSILSNSDKLIKQTENTIEYGGSLIKNRLATLLRGFFGTNLNQLITTLDSRIFSKYVLVPDGSDNNTNGGESNTTKETSKSTSGDDDLTFIEQLIGLGYLKDFKVRLEHDLIDDQVPDFIKKLIDIDHKMLLPTKDGYIDTLKDYIDENGGFHLPEGQTKNEYLDSVSQKIDRLEQNFDGIDLGKARRALVLSEILNNLDYKTYDDKFEEILNNNDKNHTYLNYINDENYLKQWKTKDTSLNELIISSQSELDVTQQLIKRYIGDMRNSCSYYPGEPLLKYLKRINEDIDAMTGYGTFDYTGQCRYKNLWVYKVNNSGNLIPNEINLSDTNEAYLKLEGDITEGYNDQIHERWKLNCIKGLVAGWNVYTAFKTPSLGFASIMAIGIGTEIINNRATEVEKALDQGDTSTLEKIFADLSMAYGATTKKMSSETQITTSVKELFNAVENWKLIDPPINLEVRSLSIQDMVTGKEDQSGYGEAVAVIKNNHTGNIVVSPSLNIYSHGQKIISPEIESKEIKVGETITIKIPIMVPRSTLADTAGFDALISFGVAEPETMTISSVVGPFITHFYAGTEKQINTLRGIYNVSQPLGGELNPGQQSEITYAVNSGSKEVRVLIAAKAGTKLEMHIYDSQNNHLGATGSTFENKVAGSECYSLTNNNDYIRIVNCVGPYKIVVKLPVGMETESYNLQIQELPDMGSVPDVSIAQTILSTSKNFKFKVGVYEDGLQKDIDRVEIKAFGFTNEQGLAIQDGSISIKKGKDEAYIPQRIKAGEGLNAFVSVKMPESLPDGIYQGNVTVTAFGPDLSPDLCRQTGLTSVTDSVYGWIKESDDGSRYSITIPLQLYIDTVIPEKPTIDSISLGGEELSTVTFKGHGNPNSGVYIYIDGTVNAIMAPEKDGTFGGSIELPAGRHEFKVKSMNLVGSESEFSEARTVFITGADRTGPVITPLRPLDGATATEVSPAIEFMVEDDESIVNPESLKVWVDGSQLAKDKVANTEPFTWKAAPGNLSDGPHSVMVSVYDYAENTSTLNWSFIMDTSLLRDTTLTSSSFEIDNVKGIIGKVPAGLQVSQLLSGISSNGRATVKVLESDNITEVASGNIIPGMVVLVTAGDKVTKKVFTLKFLDTEAPSVPSGLKVVSRSPGSITLEWQPSTDNEGISDYELIRDGEGVARTAGTTYTDIGLTQGTQHAYRVKAFDAGGNYSAASSELTARTVDTEKPQAPSGLTAANITGSSVTLNWNAPSDNVGIKCYDIRRNGTKIWSVAEATYTNTNLIDATDYSFGIIARDYDDNESEIASISVKTPDTTPPSMPSGLKSSGNIAGTVSLDWNESTDNVAVKNYKVYRNGTYMATVPYGTTLWDDTTVANQVTYSYTVYCFDTSGNQSVGGTLSVTSAGAIAKPDVPVLSINNPDGDGSFSVTMDLASGNNGSWWKLYENDVLIYSGGLADKSPSQQTVTKDISGKNIGTYNYRCELSNSFGKTVSNTISVNVSTLGYLNVAANRATTSSAALSSASARITDGIKATNNYATASSNLQWVSIDFGKAYNVNKVKLWHYFGDTRKCHDVIVQLSETSDFSSGVTTVFNNDSDNSAGQGVGTNLEYTETSSGKTITFSPLNARYIRIWGNGNTKNIGNHFVEIEVWTASTMFKTSKPNGVAMVGRTASQIQLNWQLPLDKSVISGYNIYRNGVKIATTVSESFTDTGLTPGTQYTYTIRSFNSSLVESDDSEKLVVSTNAT